MNDLKALIQDKGAIKALPISKVQRRKLASAIEELANDDGDAAPTKVDASVLAWLGEVALPQAAPMLPRIGVVTLHDIVHVRMADLDEIQSLRKVNRSNQISQP